jgi:pyrroloquinoline quinone biosynthesis protein D
MSDEPLPPVVPSMPRLNRRMRMQWEEAQNCYVLLYPEGMVRLNGSAGEILKCCDGATSVAAIIATLEQKFNMPALKNDVESLLAHAYEQDWIQ